MSLKTQLLEDMKQAMKAGDATRLQTIRFIRSQLQNHEIDHGQQDDEGVLEILAKEAKQIRESISEYQKGGRADLVDEEKIKLQIVEEYLPTQLSQEELEKIVNEILSSLDNPEMGPAIGQVMARVKGKADGGQVAQIVKAALNK